MSTERRTRNGAAARVTIQDVARLAGVSIATVSRVLNGHPDVSQVTRAEVMHHAQETGYLSNRVLDLRPAGRVRLVGLVTPDLRGQVVSEIVAAAADVFHGLNARLVICGLDPRAPDDLPLRDRLLPDTTDGALLIMPTEANDELLALRASGFPFVVIEPTMPIDDSIPAVSVTNWAGAKAATEHLIGLGHTHIGVVTGPRAWRISDERLAGYHAALHAASLPLSMRLVQEAAEVTIAAGQEAADKLLALPRPPTAIIAFHDAMALGTLMAARARDVAVPHDLSIVGFDDVEAASITTPALTTVQQPLQGLGRVGADMLWKLIEEQELDATRLELSTRLIVRDSTASPRGGSFMTV